MTKASSSSPLLSLQLNAETSGRRGRVFLPIELFEHADFDAISSELDQRFADDDDDDRLSLLEQVVSRDSITVDTYPGETEPHELHAYVQAPGISASPLFACVLAPNSLLEQLARTPPRMVFETATFQVVGDELTNATVTAALETWIRRVWPTLRVPQIRLTPWPGPVDSKQGTLEILRHFPTVNMEAQVVSETSFSPPANLVADEFLLRGTAA